MTTQHSSSPFNTGLQNSNDSVVAIQDDWALDEKYANLTVLEDDYFHNSVRFHKFTFDENLDKLEKLVNRTKWSMTPPQVFNSKFMING